MVLSVEKLLSTQIRHQQAWFKTLEETIKTQGMQELSRLAQLTVSQQGSDPEIIPSLGEFWGRLRVDFDQFLFLLGNLKYPQLIKSVLRGIPKGAGFFFSFPIPHTDFRFSGKGSGNGAVFFHRPLILWTRLFISWLERMLSLSSLNPQLSIEDKNRLVSLSNTLKYFGEGFDLGVYRKELILKLLRASRLRKRHGTIEFNLEPHFFSWLEGQVDLLQKSRSHSP
jgi:hypothetical protein